MNDWELYQLNIVFEIAKFAYVIVALVSFWRVVALLTTPPSLKEE
jgi:hypothetical protein